MSLLLPFALLLTQTAPAPRSAPKPRPAPSRSAPEVRREAAPGKRRLKPVPPGEASKDSPRLLQEIRRKRKALPHD